MTNTATNLEPKKEREAGTSKISRGVSTQEGPWGRGRGEKARVRLQKYTNKEVKIKSLYGTNLSGRHAASMGSGGGRIAMTA